jgi:hypothetical protein
MPGIAALGKLFFRIFSQVLEPKPDQLEPGPVVNLRLSRLSSFGD